MFLLLVLSLLILFAGALLIPGFQRRARNRRDLERLRDYYDSSFAQTPKTR
jgi:hypothetical protein